MESETGARKQGLDWEQCCSHGKDRACLWGWWGGQRRVEEEADESMRRVVRYQVQMHGVWRQFDDEIERHKPSWAFGDL